MDWQRIELHYSYNCCWWLECLTANENGLSKSDARAHEASNRLSFAPPVRASVCARVERRGHRHRLAINARFQDSTSTSQHSCECISLQHICGFEWRDFGQRNNVFSRQVNTGNFSDITQGEPIPSNTVQVKGGFPTNNKSTEPTTSNAVQMKIETSGKEILSKPITTSITSTVQSFTSSTLHFKSESSGNENPSKPITASITYQVNGISGNGTSTKLFTSSTAFQLKSITSVNDVLSKPDTTSSTVQVKSGTSGNNMQSETIKSSGVQLRSSLRDYSLHNFSIDVHFE